MKHPSKPKQEFPYGLAAYPLSWKGYVVSPQKICIQFLGVQCKTRPLGLDYSSLKRTNWGSREMPIDTLGTNIDTLAVGIPTRLYPEVLTNVLDAIEEHDKKHPEHSLKEFMLSYAQLIQERFNGK